MPLLINIIIFPLVAYLFGSLSAAIWMTRHKLGIDVRAAGSKHATTTNTIRQAGWRAGLVVFGFDLLKGFLPVYAALLFGLPDWLIGLTGAAAVAGHCWPIYYGFRGGMGLATAGGGYLAVSPLGLAVGFGLLLTLVLLIRHSARASFIAAIITPIVLWLLSLGTTIVFLSSFVGLILAARFTVDLQRKYRELWLDRDPGPNPSG